MSTVVRYPGAADLNLGSTRGSSEISSGSTMRVQWSRIIPVERLEPWQIEALRGLLRAAALPANWDSYGSPPPTASAIEASLRIIGGVAALSDLPAPDVVPVGGGGIQFEWRSGERELEVKVLPEGLDIEFIKVEGDEVIAEGSLRVFNLAPMHALLAWLANQ